MVKTKIQSHGFIAPKITTLDYALGALERLKGLPNVVIRPDGQWADYLPMVEYQNKAGLETMNCTNYGTLNCIETLHKALYQTEVNYSERYLGVLSGTTPNGNSPHTVAETIRKYGSIPEAILPFSDNIKTWNAYYSPKPMTQDYINMGEAWLDNYDFGHEWVWTWSGTALKTKQERLMETLKYSPVGVSVLAWKYSNGYYVKNKGEGDNHWVMLYGYLKDKYWLIYDHYDTTIKKLAWNYDFLYAKRYYINNTNPVMEDSKKKMEMETLTKIYQELLLREPDQDALPYLRFDEDFVRQEVGKSEEREQIIKLVNWARNFKLMDFFKGLEIIGQIKTFAAKAKDREI